MSNKFDLKYPTLGKFYVYSLFTLDQKIQNPFQLLGAC